MVINDWFVSPVFQAEYSPTNGIDNLPIELTGDNLSISVAIQNEKVIKGMRLYSTSDTNMTLLLEDYFASVDATWTEIQAIPSQSRIVGLEL